MAQAKKKQATKTAKKATQKSTCSHSKTARCTKCSNRDRNHIFFITAMSMVAAILLCANVAMMMA